jgi:hypothetical protein
MHALIYCMHPCLPSLCTLPQHTKKWLIAGYLGVEHANYTHAHKHVHGWGFMYVRFHLVDLFIINASNIGNYIKLLA